MPDILTAIAVGIGATVLMDLWNLFLKRAFGLPSLNYCMLGRWVRHMPGAFRHASIAAASKKSGECVTGWLAHYSIGISLAIGFVLIVSGDWLARPTLVPALVITAEWDLTGLAQDARLLFRLGYRVASDAAWPVWKPGTEFKATREASLKE